MFYFYYNYMILKLVAYLLTLVMLMIYYVPVLLAYKKTLNLCAEYALEYLE